MPDEQLAGQDAPVVDDEAQNLNPEQQTGTTEAQTDGADGGTESPAQPKTFTQEEVNAIVAREKAREARRALREMQRQPPSQPQQTPQQAPQEGEPSKPRVTQEDVQAYLAQQRAQESLNTFLEKAEDAVERFPDYMTVVTDPRLPFNEEMIDFFADSEVGTDLAYHLAKNPAKALAIARLSPLKAGRELTRLEAELKAKPKATPSKAPDPITPVGSRGNARSSPLPSDDDDMETWARKERERVAKRG
jgi:hypothetical protein